MAATGKIKLDLYWMSCQVNLEWNEKKEKIHKEL